MLRREMPHKAEQAVWQVRCDNHFGVIQAILRLQLCCSRGQPATPSNMNP